MTKIKKDRSRLLGGHQKPLPVTKFWNRKEKEKINAKYRKIQNTELQKDTEKKIFLRDLSPYFENGQKGQKVYSLNI